MPEFFFLDVSLELAEGHEEEGITAVYFKNHVMQSMKTLFGETGTCIDVDILKYNEKSKRAVIRCPASSYVKLRSALSLTGTYSDIPCSYRVHCASASPLSLLGNSRNYIH